MKKCIIIGGGIIGLCSAYYLSKEGHEVTVLDRSDFDQGCSYGNAGMIVPSHFIPLAQPGMIAKGVRWMFNSESPFYVEPRLNSELFRWGLSFFRSASQRHVDKVKGSLLDISLLSKSLYRELVEECPDLTLHEKGLLMLFQSNKVGDEEIEAGHMAQELGLEVDILEKNDLAALEIGAEVNAIGGVHYRSDAHINPGGFMNFLKEELKQRKVQLVGKAEFTDVTRKGNSVSEIHTTKGSFVADEVVICAGSWSPIIAKKFDVNIQLLPGKGYSFDIPSHPGTPSIPSILCEGKVAVSPFESSVRFGGTLEITQVKNDTINPKRVKGIVDTIRSFYPQLEVDSPPLEQVWSGFRPCTPTGMPMIKKDDKLQNLTICTGHGMMGLSLAPASGKLVSELVSETTPSITMENFK
ncbi:MAG: FAD-dependent oxidoreductase [Flavobacteriales bacterium]|nr:FAD-dependent oxidoreductase [Flavobacteriales bacterium]